MTDNRTIQKNRPGLNGSVEPSTLVTRSLPNDLFVANWNGVLNPGQTLGGVGFIGAWNNRRNGRPTNVSLNNTPCSVA